LSGEVSALAISMALMVSRSCVSKVAAAAPELLFFFFFFAEAESGFFSVFLAIVFIQS